MQSKFQREGSNTLTRVSAPLQLHTIESIQYEFPGSDIEDLSEAMEVASCKREVVDLRFIWLPTESPFYFVGRLGSEPVFIKVWLEGDENTNLKMIDGEIELLFCFNQQELNLVQTQSTSGSGPGHCGWHR
jgi:hypothetical protein